MEIARRFRQLLGRCWLCWGRASVTAAIRGQNASGQSVDGGTYRLCATHARSWAMAAMSVQHTGTATFENGQTISWGSSHDDDDADEVSW